MPAGHLAALEQLRAIAYREARPWPTPMPSAPIMLAFLVTTPLVLLLRKVTPPKAPPADAH